MLRTTTRFVAGTAALAATALALAACSSSDPLATEPDGDAAPAGDTIVIGSQQYPSNEIIAEIYAQALEADGQEVTRQFSIGQRDAYVPEIENGRITLFPEYSGDLLQYLDPDTTAVSSDDVYAALQEALPDGLTVLDQADASDGNSYTVTGEFAEEWDLTAIPDLANVTEPLTLGGPPELEERPYGPAGAERVYGLDLGFSATAATTLDALLEGQIQIGNIYTADPAIETEGLVVLEDPENLILAANIVPVVQEDAADQVSDVINAVQAVLTSEELIALNVQSTVEQRSAADIATEWLTEQGLI